MEQSADFQAAFKVIHDLETQESNCSFFALWQEFTRASQLIETHFEECLLQLAIRKDELLDEVNKSFAILQKQQELLCTATSTCRDKFDSGSSLFTSNTGAANNIWKELANYKLPNQVKQAISVNFPLSFIDSIRQYGTVSIQLSDCPESPPDADMSTSSCSLSQSQSLSSSDRYQEIIVQPISSYIKATSVTTLTGPKRGIFGSIFSTTHFPHGIAVNPNDTCLYFCDQEGNNIKKIAADGSISTFTILNSECKLDEPVGIVINFKDNSLLVTNDHSHTIHLITFSGRISVFAGNGEEGHSDGVGKNASFFRPRGITIDQSTGNVFVADTYNHKIRRITPDGAVSTLAGSGNIGFTNGVGTKARFYFPTGIVFDEIDQSLLVCDERNDMVRRVSLTGEVSTICEIPSPTYITLTDSGDIIVSSKRHNRVSVLTVSGGENAYEISQVIGSGERKSRNGLPDKCGFDGPYGIAFYDRICYVTEIGGSFIRKIAFENYIEKDCINTNK